MPRSAPKAVSSVIRLVRQSTTVPKVSKTMATGCRLLMSVPPAMAYSQAVGADAVKRGLQAQALSLNG